MRISLKFELRDLWIGVYWSVAHKHELPGGIDRRIDVYICLLPCLPIHIRWQKINQA